MKRTYGLILVVLKSVFHNAVPLILLTLFSVCTLLPVHGVAGTPSSEDRKLAKQLYAQAEKKYRLGEFSAAVDAYKRAYALAQIPALALNVAQCYRQLGKAKKALFYYKLYLADWARDNAAVKTPYEEEVNQRIVELEHVLKKEQQDRLRLAATQPATRPAAMPPVASRPSTLPTKGAPPQPRKPMAKETVETPDHKPTEPKRKLLWLIGSIASASLAVGAESLAIVYAQKANEHFQDLPPYQADRNVSIAGHVMAGVFAATAVASLVLYLTRGKSKDAKRGAMVLPNRIVF